MKMTFLKLAVSITLAAALLPTVVLGAANDLPSNVTTTAVSKRAVYIDTIDFSYQTLQPTEFSKLKLCVAENISNNAVSLQDSAGSFVGPATGNYYQNNRTQTVQGSGIFKYLDDNAATLIATGTADGGKLAFTRDVLKFDLKAGVSGNDVTIKFSNITRAQQNTGSSANNGFNPVGVWKGARAKQVYGAIEAVANKVKSCAQ